MTGRQQNIFVIATQTKTKIGTEEWGIVTKKNT